MRLGMKTKTTNRLSILRVNDHFRDWHTLDDERLCALCGRQFTGHDVVISTMGDEVELYCPTPQCRSRVHQWVHPGNPLVSEQDSEDWWHALSSYHGLDNTGGGPSPQPI
jgi:hypothetical protein